MFKDMKALPKAILIAAPIALAIWAYSTFVPKSAPEPAPVVLEVTTVPAESEAVKRAEALISQPKAEAPQAEPVVQEPVQGNVSSGTAGMAALLKAGKK